MKCIIIAAGYATRLYPLTENFPKPLLPVQGRAILDWLIEDIDGSGLVDEYIVVSNHKFAHHFQDWAAARNQEHGSAAGNQAAGHGSSAGDKKSGCNGARIRVLDDGTSSNETRLGAVRDIQLAIDSLESIPEDGLLVIAGDNLLDFSLQRFVSYAREHACSCIMRYWEPDRVRCTKSGIIEVDQDDRVIGMEEKPSEPKTNWCCPPFYYYTAADARLVAEGIADGCGVDAPGSYVAWLCGRTTVHAMEMPGKRYDIGNLASYEAVQQDYPGIVR